MTLFRPCIDLHDGRVKQIVGSSLRGDGSGPDENFVADEDAAYYARRYRDDNLRGGHVIRLGPGNDDAARRALGAWPGRMQLGGGIRDDNADEWFEAGASKLIVTSWLFEGDTLRVDRARVLAGQIGRERLVFDLSCRRVDDGWRVATEKWQRITNTPIEIGTFERLAEFCSEFLVHAADAEGRCEGIDEDLVRMLGEGCPIPCTYAGGGRDIADLDLVAELSEGRVDLTFGSALDLFGGSGVRYADCVAWNREHRG